jgi:phosphopantetheine--protein transferase-like protein
MISGAPGSLVIARAAAFGQLVGVVLPAHDEPEALSPLDAELHAEERALAAGLALARRVTFVGGRVALRRALRAAGCGEAPIASTPRGAPTLPVGFAGSIAHKQAIAVALAAAAPADVTLGIDVEPERAPRVDISARVLTPAERARVAALASEAARTRELLVAFAAKEAIYKALDPWLARYVSFQEVEIAREADGALGAAFAGRAGEPAFAIELREEALAGHVLLTARVQRRGP